jgi:D-beta-D-heptose 7-phosphate kinase/D-beta-D-heptose 1-phosphate adenosyltransferase
VNKIKSRPELKEILAKRRAQGFTVAFTNGCFDLVHAGHIHLLREAKRQGDLLVVGVNSDASVKKIKGNDRPILSETDRTIILSSLEMVDYVVVFDEADPFHLIEELQPDILVKGADWDASEIIGRELVKKVVLVPYQEGLSTTNIIKKILET